MHYYRWCLIAFFSENTEIFFQVMGRYESVVMSLYSYAVRICQLHEYEKRVQVYLLAYE